MTADVARLVAGIWSMPHAARMELYQKWASLHLDNTAAEFRAAQAQHQKATQSLQVLWMFLRPIYWQPCTIQRLQQASQPAGGLGLAQAWVACMRMANQSLWTGYAGCKWLFSPALACRN